MKRFFVVFAVLCTIGSGLSHAQEMKKGMSLFNAGLGFVPGVAINASYDYGLIDDWGPGIFTIGGFAGLGTWSRTWANSYDYRENTLAFAPRATYRYAIDKSFEVYGAAMLGALIHSYSKTLPNGTNGKSGVFFGSVAGCRYTFSGNVSVFAEIGYNDIAMLNGGLSFSF
jgi:hypothetical protein